MTSSHHTIGTTCAHDALLLRPIPELYTAQLDTLIQPDALKGGGRGKNVLSFCCLVSAYCRPSATLIPRFSHLRRMLEKNAEIRPSVRELLADPYVQACLLGVDDRTQREAATVASGKMIHP